MTLSNKGIKYTPNRVIINNKDSGYYIDFENLSPNKQYFYKIGKNKKVYFSSPKSQDDTFSFIAISDHQTFPELTEKGFYKISEEKPDFIVSAGDMLENGKLVNWTENFFNKLHIIEGIPFVASEGNNDAGFELFNKFLCINQRYYSCTYGNTKIILLDSNLSFNENSDQIKWLENTLTNNNSLWTIVVFHKGPYLSTVPDGSMILYRKTLIPILEKYNVDLVLNGHNHIYDSTKPINGITYVSLPTLSGKLSKYEINENSGYYNKTIYGKYGYGLITVSPLEIKIIIKDIDGSILDELIISK